MNTIENLRNRINGNVRLGVLSAYFAKGIFGTFHTEPAIRIVGARIRKGNLEVHALNSGSWLKVIPDLDVIYFQ